MKKKILYFYLFLFSFSIVSCGNEKSQYPDDFSTDFAKKNSVYKTYTFILYKKPYMSPNFYYFFQLAKFNNIDPAFFIPLDVNNIKYPKAIDKFFTKNGTTTSINVITIGLIPESIPLFAKLKSHIGKILYLFPDTRMRTEDSPSSYKILPENYAYNPSYAKVTTALTDETFLGYMLQFFDTGVINKTVNLDKNSLSYIQAISDPNVKVSIKEGKNQKEMREKNTVNADENGLITGVTINPELVTQFSVSSQNHSESHYYVSGLGDSFLFFNFFPPTQNTITINSVFMPLDISRILTPDGALFLQTKKLIYLVHISVVESQTGIKAVYTNGQLDFSIPKNLLPVSYSYNVADKKETVELRENSIFYDMSKGKLKLQNLIGMDNKNEVLDISIEKGENPPL